MSYENSFINFWKKVGALYRPNGNIGHIKEYMEGRFPLATILDTGKVTDTSEI